MVNLLRGAVLILLLTSLTGCGKSPLSLLSGGGPNVAANTQLGKTNTQTIGQTNLSKPTVSVRPKARVDSIDQSTKTVTNNELPTWLWIVGLVLFIIGWVTDTPSTYLTNFRKKPNG